MDAAADVANVERYTDMSVENIRRFSKTSIEVWSSTVSLQPTQALLRHMQDNYEVVDSSGGGAMGEY